MKDIRPKRLSIHSSLRPAMILARARYRIGKRVHIGEMFTELGPSAPALLAMLLALPFISPLSLGPITAPFAIAITFLGWRLAYGKVGLPAKAKWMAVPLPEAFFKLLRRLLTRISRWLKWNRQMIAAAHPDDCHFESACGWGIFTGGLLLGIPIPFLPLTNTFPALGIVCFCVAHLLKSKRLFISGIVFYVIGVIVFIAIALAVWFLGVEGVHALFGPPK